MQSQAQGSSDQAWSYGWFGSYAFSGTYQDSASFKSRKNPYAVAMEEDDRSCRPRWVHCAPYLGTPPELTRRQWNILALSAPFIVALFPETSGRALEEISAAQAEK